MWDEREVVLLVSETAARKGRKKAYLMEIHMAVE